MQHNLTLVYPSSVGDTLSSIEWNASNQQPLNERQMSVAREDASPPAINVYTHNLITVSNFYPMVKFKASPLTHS